MSLAAPTQADPRATVSRLLRGRLGEDVRVIDAGDTDGRAWVLIGCPTWVACQHAMFSIAANARNPLEDWRTGWRPSHGCPYTLRVLEPSEQPYD